MPDFNSYTQLYLVLGFLIPGFITLSVRAQFIAGKLPSPNEAILSYLTVSFIYYALALPLADWIFSILEPGYSERLAWFALVVMGPFIFGLFLGINEQKNILRRLIKKCGLNLIHPTPTAWDRKFGNIPAHQVLVTLKNGKVYRGYIGKESFISSDPNERDIFIQWLYDIGPDNEWVSRGEIGVLITAGEVSTIELWPIDLEVG